jgi:GTP pyrophosphokinase
LAIVEGCTDAEVVPKPPWQARKEAYIAHLQTAPLPVLRVSAADKLHNARCILSDYRAHGPALWQRFNATPQQIAWYYRSLADVFARCGAPASLVAEMGCTLEALTDVGAFAAG